MTLSSFASQYRLRVRLDECGDPVLPGRRGKSQLYFDGEQLCLMVLDGPPAKRSRWQTLGGKLWLGDISSDAAGKRAQDVTVKNIPLENARLAIKLAKVPIRRKLSDAHREALAQAGSRTRFQSVKSDSPASPRPRPPAPGERQA